MKKTKFYLFAILIVVCLQSNEPGVVSHKPADAEYLKN